MMFHGFLNLCKPRGLTSHDVVARVRAILGQRRVGHAGTLDPLAEGVLPIALGRATRLADRVGAEPKTYHARVQLGVTTSTDDAEGQVTSTRELPRLEPSMLEATLRQFEGQISQVPPAHSALKVQGQRAYALARRGQKVSLAARRVSIYELRLLDWHPPVLTLLVRCSRGTYVRSLARDIGEALGCGAHLAGLTRVQVGWFHLRWAIGLDELADRCSAGTAAEVVVSPDIALLDLPAALVRPEREQDFRHGRAWRAAARLGSPPSDVVRAYTPEGRLLGLMHYDSTRGWWHPRLALFD